MPESFTKPRLYPMVWLSVALIAVYALDRWWPVASLVSPPFHWAGLIFAIPGLLVMLHSGASFIRVKTGLLPFSAATVLVTGGLFRFSRNPMYLGMVFILLGVAVFLGSVSALAPVIIYVWIIDRQFIRNEEIFLGEIFGAEYEDYKDRVRRWI